MKNLDEFNSIQFIKSLNIELHTEYLCDNLIKNKVPKLYINQIKETINFLKKELLMIEYYGNDILTTESEKQEIIKKYFDTTSPLKLKKIPSKLKNKLVVFSEISKIFDSNKIYTEKNINEILKSITDEDYAQIRRDLVEFGLIKRNNENSEYIIP
ncbi:MAG: DUF2087 domain-containing protein [Defluviitaleaceae bacterium]|nr:DUF2087 domain-containing protein [Defluviitaleaceae bacterium]